MNQYDDTKDAARCLPFKKLTLVCAAASVLLSGCGGSSSSPGDMEGRHLDSDVETEGRLVVFDQDSAAVKVLDLDTEEVLSMHPLSGEAPRLYASPDKRYAVIIQRSDGLVSFLDSGLYTEDHGDHLHDYVEDPTLLSFSLSGSKPTHYTPHEDHAAIFFDGLEGVTSSVMLLSDASIGAGDIVGELSLSNNMHGAAKLIDEQLFTTYRDPSITETTLPAAVERYSFSDGALTFEHRYSEACPRLHGSAATDSFITFGCSDGVLVVDLTQTSYPAIKLSNPGSLLEDSRIGSLYSHPDVDDFVGVAKNQFFVINMNSPSDPYQELPVPDGVSRIAQGFSTHAETFYILGDDGNLYLFDVDADWSASDPVKVMDVQTEDEVGVTPAITVSQVEDVLFILHSSGQQVLEVESQTGEILRTINLDFTASSLAWLGLSEGHAHEHDH